MWATALTLQVAAEVLLANTSASGRTVVAVQPGWLGDRTGDPLIIIRGGDRGGLHATPSPAVWSCWGWGWQLEGRVGGLIGKSSLAYH